MFRLDAVVSGVGQSDVARSSDKSGLALAADASLEAIADAGLTPEDIDGIATFPGADSVDPGYVGAGAGEVVDTLGLQVDWYLGAAETSGQLGPVIDAAMAVTTGAARHVLCFRAITEGSAQRGVGRKGVLPGGERGRQQTQRHWSEWYAPYGAVSPANLNAIVAKRYMHEFGMTRQQLAQIALTERANAARNPKAIYRQPMTMDEYLHARMISDPLCLYDCDVPVDGATAVVVSRTDTSADLRRRGLRIMSAGTAVGGRFSWDQQADMTISGAHSSAEMMWRNTDLGPADIDLAELYDGFSFLTIQWLEALGFCGRGEAGAFVEGGSRIAFDGDLPINTQGGQLSGGRLHGLGFLHEACQQLWGVAGARQLLRTPEVAVVTAGGGPFFCGCLLLGVDR